MPTSYNRVGDCDDGVVRDVLAVHLLDMLTAVEVVHTAAIPGEYFALDLEAYFY